MRCDPAQQPRGVAHVLDAVAGAGSDRGLVDALPGRLADRHRAMRIGRHRHHRRDGAEVVGHAGDVAGPGIGARGGPRPPAVARADVVERHVIRLHDPGIGAAVEQGGEHGLPVIEAQRRDALAIEFHAALQQPPIRRGVARSSGSGRAP